MEDRVMTKSITVVKRKAWMIVTDMRWTTETHLKHVSVSEKRTWSQLSILSKSRKTIGHSLDTEEILIGIHWRASTAFLT